MEKTNILQIRKSKIIGLVNSKEYKPLSYLELLKIMDVPMVDIPIFEKIYGELISEGEIIKSSKGKIISPKNMGLLKGVFNRNARGTCFITSEHDKPTKLRILEKNSLNAINKDLVFYRKIQSNYRQSPFLEIVKIIKRENAHFVGVYEKFGNFRIVRPDDKKLPKEVQIPRKYVNDAKNGQKVLVKLTHESTIKDAQQGEIIEVLGNINEPGIDILSIIKEANIPIAFGEAVLAETLNIPDEVLEEDKKDRKELRNILMVTIDGEDTKDIDDAVSCHKTENGNYLLGVHIADVSHYVKEGSLLDKEALNRGTSVYPIDRVIPMLPPELSNGICSLNANVDRLSLSCIMEIDKNGTVINHLITKALINVNKRMTYTIVADILESGENSVYYHDNIQFISMFNEMAELSLILREKRIKRGAIEFDLPETKIILDSYGKVMDIKTTTRNKATSLIEEFMLICNETVSEEYFWLDVPFVYRNHQEPDAEKIKALNLFLFNFGYSLKGRNTYSLSIQNLLSKAESSPEENIINRVVLRSFKQARYATENIGHFGLAAKYYSHFTSPIRRYPDLQIHRIISKNLSGEMGSYIPHLNRILDNVCNQCSGTERRAEKCEREVENLKKCEYMADKIGMEFEGVISGITNWGIYVELPNNIEGMVFLAEMKDDYYVYIKDSLTCIGERYGKTYTLGEKVKISLKNVNIAERNIDFTML